MLFECAQGKRIKVVVHYAKIVARAITKGDLHCHYRRALPGWNVNYNNDTGGAAETHISLMTVDATNTSGHQKYNVDGEVWLSDTFARFESSLVFELDIDSYVIRKVQTYAKGTAQINVEGHAHISGSFQKHGNKSLGTFAVPHAPKFSIFGIPFVFDIKVPTEVGYDFSSTGSVQLDASATASGAIKYGFIGTCSDTAVSSCGFHQYSEYDYDHQAPPFNVAEFDAEVNANLEIYLLPTVVITVDHIGGPNMAVKTYLEQKFGAGNHYCEQKEGYDLQAITNVGLEVTAGADVNIGVMGHEFWDHSWGPWGVWSKKMPIWSGCLSTSDSKQPSSDGLVPGTTWTGTQQKVRNKLTELQGDRCSHYPDSMEVSMQMVNHTSTRAKSEGKMEFVGSQTYSRSSNGSADEAPFGCVVQSGYFMVYNQDGASLTPTFEGSEASANWDKCTAGSPTGQPIEPAAFYSRESFVCQGADVKQCSIKLRDQHGCSELTLTMSDVSDVPSVQPKHHSGIADEWPLVTGGVFAFVACAATGWFVVGKHRRRQAIERQLNEPLRSGASDDEGVPRGSE